MAVPEGQGGSMETALAEKYTAPLLEPSMDETRRQIQMTRERLEVISGMFFATEDQALLQLSALLDMCDQDIKKEGRVILPTWMIATAEIKAAELAYITAMEKAKSAYEIEFSRLARILKNNIKGATK